LPADYAEIREENVARYGWDTAVLDLLGHLYADRTHFIFELIQNAEDAGATSISFAVHDDCPRTCRLEVRHDGRPFTEADVRGICGVAKSTKDLTSIGKFGIGFKAVYAYTKTPRIYSGDEAFRIENYVHPHAIDPVGNELLTPGDTLFVFPLDTPADAAEIRAALRALDPAALLFLRNLKQINGLIHNNSWCVFRRQAGAHHVEIAFRAEPAIVPCARSPLYVFLPTQKETFLGFLVQGPYRTTPARDNVGEHDPDNQALVGETAVLLRDALRELRDRDMLTADALAALPVDTARFPPGSFFRPLYDAARDALADADLIPVAGGGYGKAADVRLAADPELHELFGAGNPYLFVPGSITPAVYAYLRGEVGIEEVSTPDVSADFLAAQSDQWLIRFYRYILRDLDTWRYRPVIRLEDGSQVEPSAAYLPGPEVSGFPTVRRAIAANPTARALLDALGLATPDIVDEVVELVLPKYGEELPDDHDADLALIMRALDEAPAGRRQLLEEWLEDTAFLLGEPAGGGDQELCRPGELYLRSRELETYFDGNPDVWFAADRYGPWLRQLREMGVRDTVAMLTRTPDLSGHVLLADEFGRHERGLDGFDPDAEIDGLAFAFGHASHARSEYVWNAVLAPNSRVITGVVERSVRDSFADATRETTGSAISEAARREAWLPAPDGSFRRPAELSLEDLPATFTRDENLAHALGMAQPVVAQAARQLGIPASVLWGLSAHPDLIATIEYELDIRVHNEIHGSKRSLGTAPADSADGTAPVD
jgi:hypothetical protein